MSELKLPSQVYVCWNEETDEPFLQAADNTAELAPAIGERKLIGVYKLTGAASITTRVMMQEEPP